MKKLMIAAAIVCAAALSQAATATWTTGGLAYGGATLKSETAIGYLWIVDDISSYTSITDGEKLSKAIFGDFGGKLDTATQGPVLSAKKGALDLTDGVTTYGDGSALNAIVLYKTTQEGTDYWMGNYGSYTFEAAQNAEITNMGLKIGGDKNSATAYDTAWTTAAVPEPTSGLLLLLGVAGLALRRRRA